MNLIQKGIMFYKKEGLSNTVNRVAAKCCETVSHSPNIVKEKLYLETYLRQIENRIQGKELFVVIPCIDWNIPLFQRPHQIALTLAQRENAHVLFVSDEYKYDNFAGVMQVNEGLDVVSCRIVPKMSEVLKKARNVTVFMSWPRQAHLLEYIPYEKLVYEYIDDISLFYYYTEAMKNRHYELIKEADLTVCTAQALYEDALPIAKHAILSPNAGDYNFFHNSRDCETEESLKAAVGKYSCVLGYYGCLAEWFDYDLVLEVARRKPDWCFVLVGYCFDGTVARLREKNLDNIIVYPAQEYKNLPKFVSAFDIQTIPFVINDITKSTSPVKLFEYMASGKPVITSAIPECMQYESVVIYKDADEFIEKVEKLMALDRSDEYYSIMEREAKENTWAARTEEILNELEKSGFDER